MIFHFSLFTFPFQRRQPFFYLFTFLPLNSVHDEPCQISKVDDGEHGTFPALHLIGRAAEEPHEQHAGEHHDEVECGYASYVHGLDEARYADDHEDVKHVGAYHVAYGYVAVALFCRHHTGGEFWHRGATCHDGQANHSIRHTETGGHERGVVDKHVGAGDETQQTDNEHYDRFKYRCS